jgi:hypothetical protein
MTRALAPVRRSALTGVEAESRCAWVGEVEQWPGGSHLWGPYAEQTPTGPVICRTENVSACHSSVAGLVESRLLDVATAALGAPVTAFKDKINYKQPGGAGFSPHQDRLAYPGVERVMSVLVAIDECSLDAGCLWFADGVDRLLPTDDRGVVRADVAETLEWSPAELAPGDAVCIDGFAPHYSEGNRSGHPRRVLVASYAARDEGYTRSQYYEARRAEMASASSKDGRFRISTLADFDGTEVSTGAGTVEVCTHS